MPQDVCLLDYGLDIRIKKLKLLEWERHVPVWRESCLCAETEIGSNEETLITLFYPIPSYCPHDPHITVIMLLNHEILHNIFDDVLGGHAGDNASECLDDTWMLEWLSDNLPDCYCFCEDHDHINDGR
jgi:hypothetical protein